jgi:hypothetical protein
MRKSARYRRGGPTHFLSNFMGRPVCCFVSKQLLIIRVSPVFSLIHSRTVAQAEIPSDERFSDGEKN